MYVHVKGILENPLKADTLLTIQAILQKDRKNRGGREREKLGA